MESRPPRVFTFLALLLRLPLMAFVLINLLVSIVLLALCKGTVGLFSLTTWDWGKRSRRLVRGIASAGLSLYLWLHLRLFDGGGSESLRSGRVSKRPLLKLVPKPKE